MAAVRTAVSAATITSCFFTFVACNGNLNLFVPNLFDTYGPLHTTVHRVRDFHAGFVADLGDCLSRFGAAVFAGLFLDLWIDGFAVPRATTLLCFVPAFCTVAAFTVFGFADRFAVFAGDFFSHPLIFPAVANFRNGDVFVPNFGIVNLLFTNDALLNGNAIDAFRIFAFITFVS